jgi:hypothetical protein
VLEVGNAGKQAQHLVLGQDRGQPLRRLGIGDGLQIDVPAERDVREEAKRARVGVERTGGECLLAGERTWKRRISSLPSSCGERAK